MNQKKEEQDTMRKKAEKAEKLRQEQALAEK